jgi:hypothetical protein
MPTSVLLADIADVISHLSHYPDGVRFTGPPPTASDLDLEIIASATLIFDRAIPFACKRIAVKPSCQVSFNDLDFAGMISVERATIRIVNSFLHSTEAWADCLVSASDYAAINCYSTTFQDAENSGLYEVT